MLYFEQNDRQTIDGTKLLLAETSNNDFILSTGRYRIIYWIGYTITVLSCKHL
jgi:hypothetical protein